MSVNFNNTMSWLQDEMFFQNFDKLIKIFPKGRRVGATEGGIHFLTEWALTDKPKNILWVDVNYNNIDRYVQEIWRPLLEQYDIGAKYQQGKHILKFYNTPTTIIFRSAERPQGMEGFKYDGVFINEAGIVLKNKYLYNNTILPMMMDNRFSRLWAPGTPKGVNTLFHKLYLRALEGGDRYYGKTYTSYDNPFLSSEAIKELENDLPSSVIRQEILGEFIKQEGAIIDPSWINYKEAPADCEYKMYVDLAISQKTTADFFAVIVMAKDKDNHLYVVDAYHNRLSFNEMYKTIIRMNEKWFNCEVGIESIQFQAAMADELFRNTNLNITQVYPQTDKVTRFYPFAGKMERGYVHLSKYLPPYYERELLDFPIGKVQSGKEADPEIGHDDLCDCSSGCTHMFFGSETEYHIYGGIN